MTTGETPSPLEQTIHEFVGSLGNELEELRTFAHRTDADFLVDGNIDAGQKMLHESDVRQQIRKLEDRFYDRDIVGEATGKGCNDVESVAFEWAIVDVFQGQLKQFERPGGRTSALPISTESTEVDASLHAKVAGAKRVVSWWRQDAAFLLDFSADHVRNDLSVVAYPSRGNDNVVVVIDKTNKGCNNIFTNFSEGEKVTVEFSDKAAKGDYTGVNAIHSGQVLDPLELPIIGRSGPRRGGMLYPDDVGHSGRMFVGPNVEQSEQRTDAELFVGQLALRSLVKRLGQDPNVVSELLPLPSEEFAEDFLDVLATDTIRAFAGTGIVPRAVRGSIEMSGLPTWRTEASPFRNLIEQSTEHHLKLYLAAVGKTVIDLASLTDDRFVKLRSTELLAHRIAAIKTQGHVREFFASIV